MQKASLRQVNRRFNLQIKAVENGVHTGCISLGSPGSVLSAAGLPESELYIREAVLRSHMKKHGLSAADLRHLPLVVQTPLMVYEWGEKAKSLVVITDMPRGDQRITLAVKLERGCKRMEVNEIASIHVKDIQRLIAEMNTTKTRFDADNLRYVDKTKIAVWLDLTPPKGADVRTEQQLYVAKIIQNFENPVMPSQNLDLENKSFSPHIMQKASLRQVNARFNAQLARQIAGTLPAGHIYQLGHPGPLLRAAGFPNSPIEMSATRLAEKSVQENHPFDIADIRDLVLFINDPVAVFEYGATAKNIIVDIERGDQRYLIGVHFNQVRHDTIVSDIRGIFPKDNIKWLNWIAKGKANYLHKEKIQTLIDQQRTNSAEVAYLNLDSATKILQNFENPK